MSEKKDVSVEFSIDSITIKFDNRRVIIVPHEKGMSIVSKRLLDDEEKQNLSDPNYELKTTESEVIGNRVVQSVINMGYDSMYLLTQVLQQHQFEIRARQIINTIIRPKGKKEALEIIVNCSEDEFMEMSREFENVNYDIIQLQIDKIKSRLVNEGKMSQGDNDYFGKSINE